MFRSISIELFLFNQRSLKTFYYTSQSYQVKLGLPPTRTTKQVYILLEKLKYIFLLINIKIFKIYLYKIFIIFFIFIKLKCMIFYSTYKFK